MKKKKDTVADEAKKQEELRRSVIRDFNAQNFGELWIDADRIPTEEETLEAKADFENKTKELQEKTYLIADAPNAVRVAKFLKKFLETCFWAQGYWRGVLNLNGFLDDFLKDVDENGEKDLVMEYAPMQFTYLLLENYAGVGLQAANDFALIWDEYCPIHDSLRDHVEWFKEQSSVLEKLRDRWSMLAQGYYLVILEHDEAMPVPDGNETTEGPTETASDNTCAVEE